MNQNLYEILYKNFKSDLDRTCLEIPNYKKISFRDLDILSAHFASFLNSLGLKKGDRMICQIDKSLSAIGLYLGCLRTGVIYTPLNTSYTKNEVEYFINNIEPKLFVCRPESKDIIENICSQLNVPSFIAFGTKEKDPVLNEILSTKPLNIFEHC
ncbi:MAG: AMP-binding protein, partial [Pseudomonadota bacterium]|nr:AMP-binding protein [Pseudomonadota bacterium]